MFKIKTLNPISATGLIQFPTAAYQIDSDASYPDAILVRSANMHDYDIPNSVKIIGRAGAGVNNIPINRMTQRGIPVLNTPGANANAVRELTIAGMLLASRNIYQAWNYIANLKDPNLELDKEIEKQKKQFLGFELMGKTLGIIGIGSIGVKVANAAVGLGMKVIGYDPAITVSSAWELSSQVDQAHSIEELLSNADFVSIHVPFIEETKNLINHARLKLMKKTGVLINFSRDGIIDNDALFQALQEKKLFSYVCDFPNQQLKNLPQVITLPHLGASTKEAEENCSLMVVKQVRDFLETGAIKHSVNFPSIELAKNANAERLAIVNSNIPNMVAQLSTKIAEAKLNIISLMNKSRDDIAYTLLDVSGDVNEMLIKDIAAIEGIINIRKIKLSAAE